jgi:F-type H+-transporting ATPase subunit alpha
MKQKQYSPLSIAETAVSLFAAEKGYLNDVALNKIVDCEAALHAYVNNEHAELMATINEKGDYNKDIEASLNKTLELFKSTQTW